MALNTSLKVLSVDSKATRITIQDTTGQYSESNLGGYGNPNPSVISSIIITVARLGCKPSHVITQKLYNPVASIPSIGSIMGGVPVVLDSFALGGTEGNLVVKPFTDGVLDIAMHTVLDNAIAVTGDECRYTLNGAGLDVLINYEHVLVGTHLYAIDKSKNTLDGTVLYLKEPLKESVTSVYPVSSAYTKAFIDSQTNNKLINSIAELANPHILATCDVKDLTETMKLFVGKFSAQVSFEKKDYHRADEILNISKDL